MTLWSDFLNHQGRTIHKWKHYFPAYERHFSSFVNRPMTFIEIGCGRGGSLQLWKRYFGPHAQIVGIDIGAECKEYEEDQVAVRIGNQSDPAFLQSVLDEFGTPDVVLDDGSHIMADVIASFSYLYGRTARDGVYAVEDLHTAYHESFGGGLRRPGTFMELCKGMLDDINAVLGGFPPTDITFSTQSMHFYDSMVFFERGWTTQKRALMSPPAAD